MSTIYHLATLSSFASHFSIHCTFVCNFYHYKIFILIELDAIIHTYLFADFSLIDILLSLSKYTNATLVFGTFTVNIFKSFQIDDALLMRLLFVYFSSTTPFINQFALNHLPIQQTFKILGIWSYSFDVDHNRTERTIKLHLETCTLFILTMCVIYTNTSYIRVEVCCHNNCTSF